MQLTNAFPLHSFIATQEQQEENSYARGTENRCNELATFFRIERKRNHSEGKQEH